MADSLALTQPQKKLFEHLAYDIKYALKGLSADELFVLIRDASIISAKITYETKKYSLKKTVKFLDNTINRYKQEGVLNSLKADTEKLQDFLVRVPGNARMLYENFLSLNREKQIEIAAVTVITLLIFFIAAGGFDFEGGVPDMDIMVAGIGSHRSLFTHSILIGFGIEFTGRFTLLLLNKVKNRMPADKHPAWDKIYSYIDKHKEKAIAAIWLGIGTHLIKDSGILGGGVTPYKDLPFSMPMDSHQALFAANGTASQIFGINAFGN